MTDDDLTGTDCTGAVWPATSRLKALLLLALESPIGQDSCTPLESAADASRRLTALGQRLGIPGAGLLEYATAPTASVHDLVPIKEAAKVLAERAEGDEDREAAVLLYHVAIAAAFCRYDLDISSRPIQERRELYDRVATRFAGFALGEIFREAVARIDRADRSS